MAQIINRKGQVTIWVILALGIVAVVALVFLGGRKEPQQLYDAGMHPEPAIESCARKAAQNALDKMLLQGGFIAPRNTKMYQGINISYLCENEGYFEPCVNQHPLLLAEMRAELERAIASEIDGCFLDLKDALEKQNTIVSLAEMHASIVLGPGRVRLEIEREMHITERGQTHTFSDFTTEFAHPTYELIHVAEEIASQEAKYCSFEYVGYMILYPNFDIKKVSLSDSTKIYTVRDVQSGSMMNIAIRGCGIPGGV